MIDCKIGDKVTYVTPYKREHGIVKGFSPSGNVFVVYNCGGDWENFRDYTGASTEKKYLRMGWV